MELRVYGIRHHGPGSARALRAALDTFEPGLVLVEGPPDADEAIPHVSNVRLRPPIALLVYPDEAPGRGAFYPFAAFSPEWIALRWAAEHGVGARFMDLPVGQVLALDQAAGDDPEPDVPPRAEPLRADPVGHLAALAGYADREEWWERNVEQRVAGEGLFDALLDAMSALRDARDEALRAEAAEGRAPTAHERREAAREAAMRRTIRAAIGEGHGRIAVVCGAWHAPALAGLAPGAPAARKRATPSASADAATLRGLKRLRTTATWVPWTHGRLGQASGYGAGVAAPGWYAALWADPDEAPVRFTSRAAALLREEGIPASPAAVVDAVRLADALAALRDRPRPGLGEVRDALTASLCGGHEDRLELVRARLEIGEDLGSVPPDVGVVPLARDLAAEQRRLRMAPTPDATPLDLDLRKDAHRDKSRLLHRLRLLGVDWGVPDDPRGQDGTFHEWWVLRWDPTFAVRLVERSRYGNTIVEAAAAYAREAAAGAGLADLAALLGQVLVADLPVAADVLAALQAAAAGAGEIAPLLDTLPPLAEIVRYGDARGTDTGAVRHLLGGLSARALVGLPLAARGIDDDAATELAGRLTAAAGAVARLRAPDLDAAWAEALAALGADDDAHPRLRGHGTRAAFAAGLLPANAAAGPDDDAPRQGPTDTLATRVRRELSPGAPPEAAVAWLEGFLAGPAAAILPLVGVWAALDAWLVALADDAFPTLLPAVRRAFAGFTPAERRRVADHVRTLGAAPAARPVAVELDEDRLARVLPTLASVLGPVPAAPERP